MMHYYVKKVAVDKYLLCNNIKTVKMDVLIWQWWKEYWKCILSTFFLNTTKSIGYFLTLN